MVCWSLFQISMGFVTTYGQLLAIRFCLGLFESGLFPGLNFFLTGWYRRDELNKRAAIFFAGAVLAGAFGGIFGYAWSRMAGLGGREGWSWIFIMEGILTFIVAVASFWMIHDWPDQAKFLTPLERELVLVRLKQEQGLAGEGHLSWSIVKKALKDWKVYCLMLMYLGAAEPLYS
jgi:MFS family permease